jgi:mono/diheme cytochrome c family protein
VDRPGARTGGGADGLYGRIDLGATPPDVIAPTVSITSPAANATVGGTVTLSINATDNVGVTGARFFAGTAQIGVATTAPFSLEWDTTTVADGSVPLTAQVTDAAGNVSTSAGVTVTVNNAAPTVTLSQLQAAIFTPRCSGCHTGVGSSLPGVQNLTAGNTFAAIVGVASIEQPALKKVAPGDPDHSYLVQKIEGAASISGARMPFGGPFLTQAEINLVRAWIAQGALNN